MNVEELEWFLKINKNNQETIMKIKYFPNQKYGELNQIEPETMFALIDTLQGIVES